MYQLLKWTEAAKKQDKSPAVNYFFLCCFSTKHFTFETDYWTNSLGINFQMKIHFLSWLFSSTTGPSRQHSARELKIDSEHFARSPFAWHFCVTAWRWTRTCCVIAVFSRLFAAAGCKNTFFWSIFSHDPIFALISVNKRISAVSCLIWRHGLSRAVPLLCC